jgi:hypothetical protein
MLLANIPFGNNFSNFCSRIGREFRRPVLGQDNLSLLGLLVSMYVRANLAALLRRLVAADYAKEYAYY